MDLRMVKSKKRLKQAWWEVLEEKNYDSITITNVMSKAGMNRKTFYGHYETLEELTKDCLMDVIREFSEYFWKVNEKNFVFEEELRRYVRYVSRKREVFRLIQKRRLEGKLFENWRQWIYARSLGDFGEGNRQKAELYLNYCIFAQWGHLIWILDNIQEAEEKLVSSSMEVYKSYLKNYLQLLE